MPSLRCAGPQSWYWQSSRVTISDGSTFATTIAQTLTSTSNISPQKRLQNPPLRPLALLLRGGRLVGRVVVAGLELVDGGADGEVGHEVLRVEDEARLRRRVVADEPLLDGVALV